MMGGARRAASGRLVPRQSGGALLDEAPPLGNGGNRSTPRLKKMIAFSVHECVGVCVQQAGERERGGGA